MTAEKFVNLIEEMTDLKIQQFAESSMRPTAEIAKILRDKRETDHRRLNQIKAELIRTLET
jgi:predicted transcriptional regulator